MKSVSSHNGKGFGKAAAHQCLLPPSITLNLQMRNLGPLMEKILTEVIFQALKTDFPFILERKGPQMMNFQSSLASTASIRSETLGLLLLPTPLAGLPQHRCWTLLHPIVSSCPTRPNFVHFVGLFQQVALHGFTCSFYLTPWGHLLVELSLSFHHLGSTWPTFLPSSVN